jgi:hypothetical protein
LLQDQLSSLLLSSEFFFMCGRWEDGGWNNLGQGCRNRKNFGSAILEREPGLILERARLQLLLSLLERHWALGRVQVDRLAIDNLDL